MADEVRVESSLGEYFTGGSSAGSKAVGWDYSNVRSMHYKFHTPAGSTYTHFRFYGPPAVLNQGEAIELRFAISNEYGEYTGASGAPQGSEIFSSESWNEKSVTLQGDTDYYITVFPGTTHGSTGYFGLYLPFGYTDPSEDWISVYLTVDSGGGGGGQTYTKCTPPTAVALSTPYIVAPGANSRLGWSGATAGQNMNIYGYDIYRSTSSSSGFTYYKRVFGNSTTVSASTTRGESYYYRVKTIGTVSGYDSNLSSAVSAAQKANTLPGAPTVSADSTVVPSGGGDITFTVTPGSDDDGQTLTLAYSTSPTGEKTTFVSPLTITVAEPTTFYFYTYDQIEYSTSVSQAITLNDKPEIYEVSHSTLGTYFALNSNGTDGYQLSYASNITPTISVNKPCTVITRIEYYSSNDTTVWPSTPPESYGYHDIEIPITATVHASLGLINIHQYISLDATNIHWRLRLQLFDGGEYSDIAYYPTDSYYYCIARPSEVLAQYNQFANSDITGTITGQMWRNVRLKIYNDTSVTIPTATAIANSVTFTGTVTSTVGGANNEYRYLDITYPDGILSGATISITATMKDSANSIGKSTYTTMVETQTPILTTLSHGAGVIKPFTQTGTFEIATVWPFGLYEHVDATTLAAYNCSTTPSDVIKLIYSSTGVGDGANRVVKTFTWNRNGDNLVTTMEREEAYDWDHTIGISVYGGSQTYYTRLEIINLFGKVISTPWISRVFNFAEPIQSSEITSIDWSLDKQNWSSLGARAIQEGVYIRLNCSFSLFTTDEIELSVLLKNSSGERSVTCYESGSEADPRLTPITYANTELVRASSRTPVTNTKSYVFYVDTEIADTTVRQWRLQFKNSGYTTNSQYFSTPVVRHCKPNLVLVDCDSNENYELTYIYNMTDLGYDSSVQDNSIINYLSNGTVRMASTAISNAVGQGVEGTIQATETGWEVEAISVEMVTTVVGLYSHTKTFYSIPVLVFQISPTVAYRKNQLGINSAVVESNAIVDIHQADGRDTVLVQGFTTDFEPAKFEIDITTGKINFYIHDDEHDIDVLQHSLDLLNGTLT